MAILNRKKIFSKTTPGPTGPTGSVGGTGITNQVTYWAGTTTLTGDNNFTWDPINFVFSIQDTLGTNLITADANTGYFNISTSGYTFYYDGTSGTLNLDGPLIWNTNTYFPPAASTAGVLTNDGSGNLTWVPAPSGGLPTIFNVAYGSTTAVGGPLDVEVGFIGGSGSSTVNLPLTGTVGDTIIVSDAGLLSDSNNILVDAGTGNAILSTTSTQTYTILIKGEVIYLRLISNTAGVMTWKLQ